MSVPGFRPELLLEKKGILKRDGRYSRDIYLLDKRALRPLILLHK
jgi:hypothetical protein